MDLGSPSRTRGGKKCISHYSSTHSILLVGEGDFSFSSCLARAFSSAKNMVATSKDSKDDLPTKHWTSSGHLNQLKGLGCTVLHDVDVYDMHEHRILKNMEFDRIVFNFPHAGHDLLLCERDDELIRRHKELMMNFFNSASKMLGKSGEIHVLHRNDYPYVRWKLAKLAKKAGLVHVETVEFHKSDFPGYHHKRGGGIKSNKTFPLGDCFTFKFSLKECLESEDDYDDLTGALGHLVV